VTRRFAHNHEFQVNYTFSRTIDDTSGVESSVSAFMPTRLDRERGRSAFDVPHNLVAHAIIRPAGGAARGLLLRDLTLATVLTIRSGVPFTVRAGRDVNGDTHITYDRPFKAARNTGRGASFASVDLRVSRQLRVSPGRRLRAEAIVEATNLLSRTNFIAVNDVVGADPEFVNGPFNVHGRKGVPATTPLGFTVAAPARQLQLGVRVTF